MEKELTNNHSDKKVACNCEHTHHHTHEHCICEHHHAHDLECDCGQSSHGNMDCPCGHHHHNELEPHGLTINFDGVIQADINQVWKVLTDPQLIDRWSDGIKMTDYRPGGVLTYQNQEMMLLDIEPPVLLTFTWSDGTIAIELSGKTEAETVINFSHWIEKITEETAISLSNWMINLQSIAALAEGKELEERNRHFSEVLPKMREMLALQAEVEF